MPASQPPGIRAQRPAAFATHDAIDGATAGGASVGAARWRAPQLCLPLGGAVAWHSLSGLRDRLLLRSAPRLQAAIASSYRQRESPSFECVASALACCCIAQLLWGHASFELITDPLYAVDSRRSLSTYVQLILSASSTGRVSGRPQRGNCNGTKQLPRAHTSSLEL